MLFPADKIHGEPEREKHGQELFRCWQSRILILGTEIDIVDSLLQDLDALKSYQYNGKINVAAMARFIQVLQNTECQAETVGLSRELNNNIVLNHIN